MYGEYVYVRKRCDVCGGGVCVYVCVCRHTCYGRGVEIRGQLVRIACLFAPWGLEIKLTPQAF